jgi:hypothetical protein
MKMYEFQQMPHEWIANILYAQSIKIMEINCHVRTAYCCYAQPHTLISMLTSKA